MKRKMHTFLGMLLVACLLSACGQDGSKDNATEMNVSDSVVNDNGLESDQFSGSKESSTSSISNVTIQFGKAGTAYTIVMENNETAMELVRNITNAGRNLPIYDYDNFEGYEYFQYYDIPTRYDIPSNPVEISSAKAGEVYYSDPNRIILFYQDAEISGEYTKVGHIEDITGLKEAVEDNPVLEGWGNKLILLRYAN